jgi:hypothetical protein
MGARLISDCVRAKAGQIARLKEFRLPMADRIVLPDANDRLRGIE